MSLKHGLLGFLNYNDMTGYELDKAFKQSLNFFWRAQTSQIYRELNTMQKKGWLTSTKVLQEDKPNKKLYSITDLGREALSEWLSKNNGYEDISVKSGFLVKMFFSGERTKAQNIQMLRSHIELCEKTIESLRPTSSIIKNYSEQKEFKEKTLYWKSTAIYGYMHYEMLIEWCKKIIKLLEE